MTSGQKTRTRECAAMSETTREHSRFEPFVGTFAAEVKMWMGPGDPAVSRGVMTNTLELGGRFLRQQYRGDPGDGPFPSFEGHGYWGFNTVTKKYEGFWIDTASTQMQSESGEVDAAGKVWTMTGKGTGPDGKTYTKRSVIRLLDRNRHTLEMYFATPDHGEAKAMEIKYTRKA